MALWLGGLLVGGTMAENVWLGGLLVGGTMAENVHAGFGSFASSDLLRMALAGKR